MADPESIRIMISASLDSEEGLREKAYKASRQLIKSCRDWISLAVSGKEPDEGELNEKAREVLTIFNDPNIKEYPFIEDSLTEYAEALLLSSALAGPDLPTPEVMGISERAYALGVCDAVGELRRVVLNRLIEGDVDEAVILYKRMKDLFSTVEGLTYPSGMIQLKRKQDSARASIDRTQGEISIALNGRRIMDRGEKDGK